MTEEQQPIVLVCALADAPRCVPGTVFNRWCRNCNQRVMIAPSGQKVLRKYPHAIIICPTCYAGVAAATDVLTAADTADNIRAEVRKAKPNPWRNRN